MPCLNLDAVAEAILPTEKTAVVQVTYNQNNNTLNKYSHLVMIRHIKRNAERQALAK